jgi:hypothetical protein
MTLFEDFNYRGNEVCAEIVSVSSVLSMVKNLIPEERNKMKNINHREHRGHRGVLQARTHFPLWLKILSFFSGRHTSFVAGESS